MNELTGVARRFHALRREIAEAAERSGRSAEEVKLLAVSKLQPVSKMAELASALGPDVMFGESQVQEYRKKRAEIDFPHSVHMIGALQRNKARDAVALFDVIQSLHSEALAVEVAKEAAKAGKLQEVYLQVNISRDPAKSGFDPGELMEFAKGALSSLHSLKLCGLMTITRLYELAEDTRPDYRAMRQLWGELVAAALPHAAGKLELSMGMSDDFAVAVEEGATVVRIGTALFGER